ncbi:MAG: hypothetical protein ACI8XM_000139 [Haloarculaceae archaeon]|jgi:hypothetical protein
MPRDIAPLTSALEDATPGEQSAVYSLLAAWNQSIETALDRGGWNRLQEIRDQYLETVIETVDTAATVDGIDWVVLEECVDAYPPGVGDHHCSSILANVVARCVIRTRIREGVDAIPTWALEYLADITVEDDSEWTMGILTHATFADPEAGIDLLKGLLESPDIVEDLVFVDCLHAPFEQDFPDFPQYWEPDTELDHEAEVSDDVHERLLAVIGRSIDPGRLRHFDDSYRFDLERAADEYGPANDT